jgi:hypothetical protein
MISIGLFAGSLFLTTAADPTTFGTGSALLHKESVVVVTKILNHQYPN